MKAEAMRRAYGREAAVMLALAALASRVVPAASLFAWANKPPRRVRRFYDDEARWIAWALAGARSKRRRGGSCLARSFAALAMLRRRGIPAKLCLGVARESGQAIGHAWVESDGQTIVGGAEAAGFQRIAEFGG
jgi:transglutaminase-like putative cysteine protease